MLPELIFWWALAVIAVVAAACISTMTVFAAVALFKPRGKVHPAVEDVRSMSIEQVRAEIARRRPGNEQS